MKTWEIESIEVQWDYVILDLKYKKDHVNLHMHYQYHAFSYQYAVHNASEEAKHFELTKIFTNYNALWTAENSTKFSST